MKVDTNTNRDLLEEGELACSIPNGASVLVWEGNTPFNTRPFLRLELPAGSVRPVGVLFYFGTALKSSGEDTMTQQQQVATIVAAQAAQATQFCSYFGCCERELDLRDDVVSTEPGNEVEQEFATMWEGRDN